MNTFRQINGKTYKYGFTTGTCAAAAAKGAVQLLCQGIASTSVDVLLPGGKKATIPIFHSAWQENGTLCSVIKDAGDDPDVTNGIEIEATARYNHTGAITIKGGKGIGTVTRKGLQIAVGQPAINPTPLQMIEQAVRQVTPSMGVDIVISAPEGESIAAKTFNERLGIVGGISILGTSGMVIPMSDEAFKESLSLELSVLKESGADEVLLTPGNYGEHFIRQHFPDWETRTITTSNFIGYMLHEAHRLQFTKVWLVGHIGKLVKVAGGIFHTHSSVADARCEVLASHYMLYTGNEEVFRKIMVSNTTEEAVLYIDNPEFFTYLSAEIQKRCAAHLHQKLIPEVVLFSLEKGLLGHTELPPNYKSFA